jgi:UDP-3-O-[3-hydroxymyristoyl] glucosamine N-acyltransferase
MREITLADLARQLEGELEGEGHVVVNGIGSLHEAGPREVSFLSNPRYRKSMENTGAAGVIVSHDTVAKGINLIRVSDPHLGYAKAMEIFFGEDYVSTGISPQASVHPDARIGADPSIHPFAVLCENTRLGDRVTLMPGVYVGPGATVGDDSVLHPNVVLEREVQVGKRAIIHAGTIIGSDGYGFAREGEKHHKITHAGTVRVGDDVEIGANCTVDRAVMGENVIGDGSKLDNLIHVAHNVKIGRDCLILGQVGISGSTTLGDRVVIAGQSGVIGHARIGDDTIIASKTAVFKSLPAGSQVAGIPAMEIGQWRKLMVHLGKLDTLNRRVKTLEREIENLREKKEEETE